MIAKLCVPAGAFVHASGGDSLPAPPGHFAFATGMVPPSANAVDVSVNGPDGESDGASEGASLLASPLELVEPDDDDGAPDVLLALDVLLVDDPDEELAPLFVSSDEQATMTAVPMTSVPQTTRRIMRRMYHPPQGGERRATYSPPLPLRRLDT